ncbi:hypothetical protein [Candidatus Binatus soli]|jgi:hypothetical protein|uniref:hypothetical protein n=1 Tax=Candidatus Binatus soli TaxID=1953413 RepID=UPI003D1360F0
MPSWKQQASRLFWKCVPEKIRIRHSLRKLNRQYDGEIEQARRRGDWNKEQELASEFFLYSDGYYGRLYEMDTNYWRRKARRYHVPIPERGSEEDSNWKCIEDREDGHKYWYLTETGIFAVRSLIREEQKYRRDSMLAVIAAFTGAGGVLIGILSALHSK